MNEEKNEPMEEQSAVSSVEVTSEEQEATPSVDQAVDRTETEVLNQQLSVLNDQLLRTLAEFDNYRKRSQREVLQITQNASEKLITELLPVVDDMERALKAARDLDTTDARFQNSIQGFEIIYSKLMRTLQGRGLRAMESIGKPMDPNLHDALMQVVQPDQEPHTVVGEHEKGYFLNDKVIRHAKVIVSVLSDTDGSKD